MQTERPLENSPPRRLSRSGLLVAIFVPPSLVLALALAQPFVPFAELARDPFAIARERGRCIEPYTGLLTELGLFLWASAAALCFLCAAVLQREGDPARARFFASSGLLSSYLLFDDAFLVHEGLFPRLGLSETTAVFAIAGAASLHAFIHRRVFLEGDRLLLGAAALLLAFSLGVDQIIASDEGIVIVLEDGAKLLGISAWLGFHAAFALTLLTSRRKSS